MIDRSVGWGLMSGIKWLLWTCAVFVPLGAWKAFELIGMAWGALF